MAIAHHTYTVIDCNEPLALAKFYGQITGYVIDESVRNGDSDWVDLFDNGIRKLAFQRVDNYLAPTWPDGPIPQQLHLDFHVKDLDIAEEKVLALGAIKHNVQPGQMFRVFLDPQGHPFCLVKNPQ
jgi:hypothetical protein